jgi:hypothetical protein
MTDLSALLDVAEAQARKVLIREHCDQLMPTYVLICADKTALIVGCPWGSSDEKSTYIAAIRELAHERGATAMSFLAEAWSVKRPKGTDPNGVVPSTDDPERHEVVYATATDGFRTKARSWAIRRDSNGTIIELDPEVTSSDIVSGRMIDGILPGAGTA